MFYEVRMRERALEIEREAEERIAELYVKLIDDGRLDDARRAGKDVEYRYELLKEYELI